MTEKVQPSEQAQGKKRIYNGVKDTISALVPCIIEKIIDKGVELVFDKVFSYQISGFGLRVLYFVLKVFFKRLCITLCYWSTYPLSYIANGFFGQVK